MVPKRDNCTITLVADGISLVNASAQTALPNKDNLPINATGQPLRLMSNLEGVWGVEIEVYIKGEFC